MNESNEVLEGTLEELSEQMDKVMFDVLGTVALGLVASGATKAVIDGEAMSRLQAKRFRLSHGVVGESKIIEVLED